MRRGRMCASRASSRLSAIVRDVCDVLVFGASGSRLSLSVMFMVMRGASRVKPISMSFLGLSRRW